MRVAFFYSDAQREYEVVGRGGEVERVLLGGRTVLAPSDLLQAEALVALEKAEREEMYVVNETARMDALKEWGRE